MAASAENDCSCSNISIMQLFHELKQKFPAVPDRVVSECIRQNFHDKRTCEAILSRENATYLLHSYPPSLKMSSESDNALSLKLHNLTLCDKCSLNRPCSSSDPSGGHLCESNSKFRNLNVGSAQYFQKESSYFSRSSESQIVTHGNFQASSPSDSQSDEESVIRGDNKWLYQQMEKCANTSELSYHGITSSKFLVPSEDTSVSSSVVNSRQFSCVDKCDPLLLVPSEDDVYIPHKIQSSESEPQLRHLSVSMHSDQKTSLTDHETYSRSTSMNVDQSSFQYHQARSAPVTPGNIDPFHCYHRNNNDNTRSSNNNYNNNNNNNQNFPGSIGKGLKSGSDSVPSANPGDGPNTRQSEPKFSSASGGVHESEDCRHGDQTVVNSYEVNVNCSLGSGRTSSTVNVTGSSTRTVKDGQESHQKAKSVINLQPAPHYANQNYWGGDTAGAQSSMSVSAFPQQPRSYTSVNLTLRPPSSEPQPPIDIQSGGTSLTYSTSSYDPNQGFRSKLQICIGPGGAGSVSAMRTQVHEPVRTPQVQPQVSQFVPHCEPPCREEPVLEVSRPLSSLAESTTESTTSSENTLQDQLELICMDHLHVATQVLLRQQLERKNRLQMELKREKEKLRNMRRSVRGMEKDLAQRQLAKNKALPAVSTVQKVQRLKQEIRKLTEECEKMAQEVDNCSDPTVPLGETDEEFYKNIYTGQHGYVGIHPPRDAPPYIAPDPLRRESAPDADARDGRSWTCSECTFRNYWELNYCEQCEMPRIMLAGRETQDIHIHVTHHNFPIRSFYQASGWT